VSEIERARASCGSIGPSFNTSASCRSGSATPYRATFAFSQALYAGGRIDAQQTQAEFGRQSSAIITTSTEAQVALDVTRAFFDAALSDRLVHHRRVGLSAGVGRLRPGAGSRSRPAASRSSNCCARRSRATTSGRS
jgi:hypothetical protein